MNSDERMMVPNESITAPSQEMSEIGVKNGLTSQLSSSLDVAGDRLLVRLEKDALRKPGLSKMANPAPLGLLGFGLTTILLNLHNAGIFPLATVKVRMEICYGGIAQFVAGLLEFTHGNTFAFVAFTSYGSFWVPLVCLWMLNNNTTTPGWAVSPTESHYVGAYLLMWGIFTLVMFFCTLCTNVGLMTVFGTLVILFLLLAVGHLAASPTTLKVAGYEGIVCGSSAVYLALAEVVNVFECEVLPVGKVDLVKLWRERQMSRAQRKEPSIPV
ncbi:Acetate transporter GPR1/FUN34/SatP family [Trypanosoma melophagium]|uniref:Acetate transporter GPR1/FUN34/SatP family n=1 Tax=Trypanosoma melophagium TaxID=715481 RepID=UPI00351A5154|nr:Acetate transporter GPR1/FUN34/SatP family [Trypanosoma melophagium]